MRKVRGNLLKSPALFAFAPINQPRKIKEKLHMSWNLSQSEYRTFVNLWRASSNSNEVLKKLKASRTFPSTFYRRPTWSNSYRKGTAAINLHYIQGVAIALRERGVDLPRLYSVGSPKPNPAAHLNFNAL